jgi:hypothetical protein
MGIGFWGSEGVDKVIYLMVGACCEADCRKHLFPRGLNSDARINR